MSPTQRPADAAVAALFETARGSRQWPHRASLVAPAGIPFVELLRRLHAELAPAGRALPGAPLRWARCELGHDSLDEAYLGAEGDGVLALSRHRGFMPGVGQTLTYLLLVGAELCVEAEDHWEDNVADPETVELQVRATSAEGLERARGALAGALSQLVAGS